MVWGGAFFVVDQITRIDRNLVHYLANGTMITLIPLLFAFIYPRLSRILIDINVQRKIASLVDIIRIRNQ